MNPALDWPEVTELSGKAEGGPQDEAPVYCTGRNSIALTNVLYGGYRDMEQILSPEHGLWGLLV